MLKRKARPTVKSNDPFQGRKKRHVKESNGLLQKSLDKVLRLGETSSLRAEFALNARATERTAEMGRDQMYTYPAHIRKSVPPQDCWDRLESAYLMLHSYEPGSLGHLLLSLHALGFRVFSKSSQALQFVNAGAIEADECRLKAIVADHAIKLPGLTITNSFNAFTSQVRGKGDQTSVEPLIVRLHSLWVGKPYKGDLNTAEAALIKIVAEKIVATFETWREMIASPLQVARLASSVLSDHGLVFDFAPAFTKIIESAQSQGDLKNCTIAFDAQAQRYDINEKPDFLITALVARYAHEARERSAPKVGAYVQEAMTTINANGLGWLFNKAPSLIPVATPVEFRSVIGLGKDDSVAVSLLELLKGITPPALFAKNVLADVRSAIQGALDSTVANHLARMESSLSALEDTAGIDAFKLAIGSILECCVDRQGLANLSSEIEQLDTALSNARSALRVLLGYDGSALDSESIKAALCHYNEWHNYVQYLIGCVGVINGAIKRGQLQHKAIEYPKQWDDQIRIFRLGPPLQSIEADRRELLEQITMLEQEFVELISGLKHQYDLDWSKALNRVTERFKSSSKETKRTALKDPLGVAYRQHLSRLTSLIYRGSSTLRKAGYEILWSAGVATDKRELREHLFERKHYVFVNPLDTKPKKLVHLNEKMVDLIDLYERLRCCETLTRSDRLGLDMFYAGVLLSGLPDEVDTKLIDTAVIRERGDRRYVRLLDYRAVPRAEAISLITTAYRSELSGLSYRANKTDFLHTRSLKPYTGQHVYYSPKETTWKVPVQMYEGRFANILKSDACFWESDGCLDVAKTALTLAQQKITELKTSDILAFLKELPHRMMVALDIAGWGVTEKVIRINAGVIESVGLRSNLVPLGQSRDNTKLIEVLNGLFLNNVKLSPPQIQFERSYGVDSDNRVVEKIAQRRVIVQIPTSTNFPANADGKWQPDNIIGIDPGVYGLGIAILDLEGNVKDKGYLHINSLISYIKSKTTHTKVTQPRQQYRAPYSNHLEKAAKAAVGDIAHVLDRLIVYFNAIPVFEMPGGGNDPSDSVWKAVISLYCWGDNDAQNKVRQNHWKGATHFDTPFKRLAPGEKTAKDFTCYPGVRVSSYGNSYQCHCCGRNAIEDAKETIDESKAISMVEGAMSLKSGNVALYMPDPETAVARRLKNRGPVYISAGSREYRNLSSTNIAGRELLTTLRRSIRRAPDDRLSKQGIESVFVCPYVDCGKAFNSEANSAVNVGRKLIQQLETGK